MRIPRTVAAITLAALVVVPGCTGGDEPPPDPEATAVPADSATVPDGWTVHEAPGFTVALPPQWSPRPEDMRTAPEAALEVGVPFEGQPVPPPLVIGFVESEPVGPLDAREQLLRVQLTSALPEATISESRPETVAGATEALSFDLQYEGGGVESVLGTPIERYTARQRELIVETPGLPKYGLRYAAVDDEFDEDLWDQIVASIVVTPGEESTESGSG